MKGISHLEMLALIGMLTSGTDGIEPGDFFGIEEEVSGMVADPTGTIKGLLKSQCGVEWDGDVKKLRTLFITECREQCKVNRGLAELGVSERRACDAAEVLRYDRAIPGRLSPNVVADAKAVVLEHQKRIEKAAER